MDPTFDPSEHVAEIWRRWRSHDGRRDGDLERKTGVLAFVARERCTSSKETDEVKMMGKSGGHWVLTAALLWAAHAPLSSQAHAATPSTEGQAPAAVRLEIRQESGDVAEARTELEFNTDETVTFQGAGHTHDVTLFLERKGKSKQVRAKVSYRRDGRPVVAPVALDLKLGQREVLRIEGGLAIALTVKAGQPPAKPPSDHAPVEPPKGGDSDDPLDGL